MIGYWLVENRQGHGIITDCVRALTDFGFSAFGLNRIYIHCAVENLKSRAVAERLGYVNEGTAQDGMRLYENYHDMVVYGMVKRNWQDGGTLCLIEPMSEHKDAALEYRQEHADSGESHIHGSAGLVHAENYEDWLESTTLAQTTVPTGFVPSTTYFAIVSNEIVGTISIRHYLNDALLIHGGHVGYGVRRAAAARVMRQKCWRPHWKNAASLALQGL